MHYYPNKNIVIQKALLSKENLRKRGFKRKRDKKSQNSLGNKKIMNFLENHNWGLEYSSKIGKHSKTFSSSINDNSMMEEEDFGSVTDEETELNKEGISSNEKIRKEKDLESPLLEQQISLKNFNKEKSQSVQSIRKFEFERNFLSKVNEQRAFILKEPKSLNILEMNLFDFSMDKPQNYSQYYPLSNFDNSIKIYRKKHNRKGRQKNKNFSYNSERKMNQNRYKKDEVESFSENVTRKTNK